MSKIIDRPWAIVYGPKYSAIHGKGLMYGLGLSREDAWQNAILVAYGTMADFSENKKILKRKGMIVQRVEVRLLP